MLDTGVGEQPFEIGLAEDEHRGHGDREQPEREKGFLAELPLPARVVTC